MLAVVVVRGCVVAAQDSTVQDSAGWLRVNYFGLGLGGLWSSPRPPPAEIKS